MGIVEWTPAPLSALAAASPVILCFLPGMALGDPFLHFPHDMRKPLQARIAMWCDAAWHGHGSGEKLAVAMQPIFYLSDAPLCRNNIHKIGTIAAFSRGNIQFDRWWTRKFLTFSSFFASAPHIIDPCLPRPDPFPTNAVDVLTPYFYPDFQNLSSCR